MFYPISENKLYNSYWTRKIQPIVCYIVNIKFDDSRHLFLTILYTYHDALSTALNAFITSVQ